MRLLEERRIGDDRPQLVGPPPVVAAHAAASSSRDRDALDVAERQLQEALAERAEERGVAGREEPVAPSRAGSFSQPLRASVSATSRAVSSAEKTSVTSRPNDALEHGPDQRVVRAAEDHRVAARLLERRGVLAHGVDESS